MGTPMDNDAMKLIAEMSRFEAEIAAPKPPQLKPARHIIGAKTYDMVQKKLENYGKQKVDNTPVPESVKLVEQLSLAAVPPPPPPPGPLPPGFGGLVPPMAAFTGIPPPPPPPAFLIPHQVKTMRGMSGPMNHRMLPAPPPVSLAVAQAALSMTNVMSRMSPPHSTTMSSKANKPILSAAPTLYTKAETNANIDAEVDTFLSEIRRDEEESERLKRKMAERSAAKAMADSVRASTTITIQAMTSEDSGKKKEKKSKKLIRMAGGQSWEDPSLMEWEDDDFRIFCGDLGNDVTDEVLTRAFNKYTSFLKAKVVRDKRTNKTKGFGFISFKDPQDFIKAMKEMNGRYVGSRPIKLRKSTWRVRSLDSVKKKEKEKAMLISQLTGR